MILGQYIEIIRTFLQSTTFFNWLLVVFLLGTFVFWSEMTRLRKLRNDIFDQWLLSVSLTVIWSRLAYVITNWDSFVNSYWFYLPYEKYADEVYLFRAMPWKLFTIWDGGFLFTAMLAGLTVFMLLHILLIKKWPVREMLNPFAIANFSMLGSVLFVYGVLVGLEDIYVGGGIMVIFAIAYKLILDLWTAFFKNKKSRNLRALLGFIFVGGESYLAWTTFFSQSLSQMDRVNMYIYAVAIGIFALLALFNFRKKNKNDPASINPSPNYSTPVRNQAIKPTSLR